MAQKTILIVDNENDVLTVLSKMLAAEGYSIITADNGSDAIIMAESKHPDLVVLDILMPGMDGTEVAARLKENPKTSDIPIIFQTCIVKKEETKSRPVIAGNVFVAKPYEEQELLAAIDKVL